MSPSIHQPPPPFNAPNAFWASKADDRLSPLSSDTFEHKQTAKFCNLLIDIVSGSYMVNVFRAPARLSAFGATTAGLCHVSDRKSNFSPIEMSQCEGARA